MDPTATFNDMEKLASRGQWDEAREKAEDLKTWLAMGGFFPRVPLATKQEIRKRINKVLSTKE